MDPGVSIPSPRECEGWLARGGGGGASQHVGSSLGPRMGTCLLALDCCTCLYLIVSQSPQKNPKSIGGKCRQQGGQRCKRCKLPVFNRSQREQSQRFIWRFFGILFFVNIAGEIRGNEFKTSLDQNQSKTPTRKKRSQNELPQGKPDTFSMCLPVFNLRCAAEVGCWLMDKNTSLVGGKQVE